MKKLITAAILSLILSLTIRADVCNNTYKDLVKIVEPLGWRVTSTTGGRHNTGSKHPKGKAVDVSVKFKNDLDVMTLTELLEGQGYGVKDERIRPEGQAVWSAPHLHLFIRDCTVIKIMDFDPESKDKTPRSTNPAPISPAGKRV